MDHKLAFTRKSRNWKCGVADVIPANGEAVWGVVYSINEIDLSALDRREGFRSGRRRERNSYEREEKIVLLNGDSRHPITAHAYVIWKKDGPFLPSREYLRKILEGAAYWHLPQEYLRHIEAIETSHE